MASDYKQESLATLQDTRSFEGSGLKAGVESGLGMVENLKRGTVQAQQQNHGLNFRQESVDESAGSSKGKNFDFRY